MLVRTTERKVTFNHPFTLGALDSQQPPGTYLVVMEEEQIQGLSFDAYQRTATSLQLPAIGARSGMRQMFPVDAEELEAALAADDGGRSQT